MFVSWFFFYEQLFAVFYIEVFNKELMFRLYMYYGDIKQSKHGG